MKRPTHRGATKPNAVKPRDRASEPVPAPTPLRPFSRGGERDSHARDWVAIAFITDLVLAAFWKLATMKGLLIPDDMFGSDLMNENFPYRVSLGRALKAGQFPLWIGISTGVFRCSLGRIPASATRLT
jgi:hypothetical protein